MKFGDYRPARLYGICKVLRWSVRRAGNDVHACELTSDESCRLLAIVDAQRLYLERLHAWMVEVVMPIDDPLRRAARDALIESRRLCTVIAWTLPKGKLRKYDAR